MEGKGKACPPKVLLGTQKVKHLWENPSKRGWTLMSSFNQRTRPGYCRKECLWQIYKKIGQKLRPIEYEHTNEQIKFWKTTQNVL